MGWARATSAVRPQPDGSDGGDVLGDLVAVALHGGRVSIRLDQRYAGIARRAHGAKNIRTFIALIDRLARPAAPLRPLADRSVF